MVGGLWRSLLAGGDDQGLLGQCSDLALDGRGIQLSVGVGVDATRSSRTTRPTSGLTALPEHWYLVTIASDTACLCANVSADDGVAGVAEVLVRRRPRPMVPGGAVLGVVMLWSVR